MALTAGTRLGPYEILGAIGAGGMGEVYRARDTKLQREVSSAILAEAPPPLPARTPVELKLVIERCLEKEPARRYLRAGEVRAALEAIQSGAMTPSPARRRDRSGRRRRQVLAGVGFVVLAALLQVTVDTDSTTVTWRS